MYTPAQNQKQGSWWTQASLALTFLELNNNLTPFSQLVTQSHFKTTLRPPSFPSPFKASSLTTSLHSLMENTLNPTPTIPTFHKTQRKTRLKSEVVHALVHDTAGAAALEKRREYEVEEKLDVVSSGNEDENDDEGDEEDKAELERKIATLQRLVPGGESLGVEKLFEETADYILALQCQIKGMRVIAGFLEGLEKEKRKFGG